jgi:hypothetical protein
MEELLAIERYKADEYSFKLPSASYKKEIFVVTQPDEEETSSPALQPHAPTTPKSSRHQQGQHHSFPAKSPRGFPASSVPASPRVRKLDSGKTSSRHLPSGYQTQEQIDAVKQQQSIKEEYFNIAANSKSNAAVKAQYELEKGYMSKHHISTLEQQIKKMQRELERAKMDAMTPDEVQQASLARKLKTGSKVVKLWTMTKEDAGAIRIQKAVKVFLKRFR